MRLSIHGNVVISVGKGALSVTVVCSQANSGLGFLLGVRSLSDLLEPTEELVHAQEDK